MRSAFLTAACVSLSLLISGALPGARRTAAAEETATPGAGEMVSPARAFVRLWHAPCAFPKTVFAATDGSTLYIGGTPRGLEALETETGHIKWLHSGVMPPEYPPIERDKVLYLVEGGQLVTLNPATGEELTRVKPRFGFLTPAYPADSHCVFASGDQYIYAVTAKTGARTWRAPMDGRPTGSTWDGSTMMYFTTGEGRLYAVSIPAMEISWNHDFLQPSCSTPAVNGNSVYVGSSDYYLYAVNSLIGDVQWKLSLSAPVLGTPVIVGSRLYVGTTEQLIHAVDLNAHQDLWVVPGDCVLTTTPEHLIFLRKGNLVNVIGMADIATGKVISEMSAAQYVRFTGPAEGGVFYAIGEDGDVLAIGDRAFVVAQETAKEAAKEAARNAPPAAAPAAAPTAPAPTAPAAEPTAQ
jgi:outer membrane protein assembly factor BamB